jgi:hypothetical protein
VTGDAIARLRAADPLHGELPAPLRGMPARPRAAPRESVRARTALTVANVLLLAAVLFHGVDHAFIQERGVQALSAEVLLGGFAITAAAALSFAATLRHDRRAALYAVLSGPYIAAAVVAGHFVGHWGEFSDPYAAADLGTISYAGAVAVVVAGVAVGAAGALAGVRPRAARS